MYVSVLPLTLIPFPLFFRYEIIDTLMTEKRLKLQMEVIDDQMPVPNTPEVIPPTPSLGEEEEECQDELEIPKTT